MKTIKLHLALNKLQIELGRLETIKCFKEILGIGLKEAKDLVDAMYEQESVSIIRNNDESLSKVINLISSIKGITVLVESDAIDKYRKALEESLDYIYVEKKLYESLLEIVNHNNSLIHKLKDIVTEYEKSVIK